MPRGRQLYEDRAELMGLGEGADWIAECPSETFLERVCVVHGAEPETLRRRADAFGGFSGAPKGQDRDLELITWCETAEDSIPTAWASSLTEQEPSRSRPRMRTRLGAASACIVSAT